MRQYIMIPAIAMLIAACGTKGNDKKSELEKLKKQQTEITQQIATLEKEISMGDTTNLVSENAKAVEVQILTESIFNHYVEVQGRVDGDENVSISPEMPGTIVKVNARVGQQVSKGTVLAEMDSKVLQQNLADIQNSLEFANTMFKKQESLWNQKIGSEVQYLSAKNQKESLEKKMATIKEQLELTRIKAPISGTLDALDVKVGQIVAPGMEAARVVNLSNLKVKAEVGESYAGFVKTGNKAIVVFPDIKDSSATKITYAAKSINPTNRTFSVEAALSSKGEYHPNMVAVLKINDYSSKTPVVIVPLTTIQKSEDGSAFVMLANKNRAHKQSVKIGKVYAGQAEIISGIEPAAKLITKGFQDLNEGDEVKY